MSGSDGVATAINDTIAAIATPPGVSGLAVIRLSGPLSIDIANSVFRGGDLRESASHTLRYGKIRDARDDLLDDVLVAVFHAPHSYTGENSIEISCHGGSIVSRIVLEALLAAGARHANPGEFTRRAFINGRMDLTQAEAVADIIHAQSVQAHRASVRQLEGSLSRYVSGMRDSLIHCAGLLELNLDFVEEGIDVLANERPKEEMLATRGQIAKALESFESGRILRDGARVVLLGKANTGKSSLLNAVLGMQRAIVTEIPGTTRDYIEEQVMLHGAYLRFVDTAGLRETDDAVEREGLAMGRALLQAADIVCGVVDEDDETFVASLREDALAIGAEFLHVRNKIDLLDSACSGLIGGTHYVSAIRGDGLEELTREIARVAGAMLAPCEAGTVLVTNARHADCLRRSLDSVDAALQAMDDGLSEEFIAVEVRTAITALGEIIGAVTTDDILNTVFARFCIGK